MSQEIIEREDRKKTTQTLIEELKSFKNKDLIVTATPDEGKTSKSVKLVSKGFKEQDDGEVVYCALHI